MSAVTTRPESPIAQALARASAGTAAARADLIALPNGTAIRMKVAEQMERRARQPIGPALAKRLTAGAGRVDWPAARLALRELVSTLSEAERGAPLSCEQLEDLLSQTQASVALMLGEVRR